MHRISDSRPVGMECPNCGWGWATTYNEPIFEDDAEYRVILESKDSSLAKLKIVSSIVNGNYLQAKKIIESAPAEIFRGEALKVREIREKLEQNNVAFRIEPEFPY